MPNLVQLFQTLSAFLVLFYLYCESPAFRPLNTDWSHIRGKAFLYLVFTCITILGNYLGTPVLRGGALLNARAVGSTLAGLLGGPILGVLVGATGGLHRMTLGGIAAFSGAVATTLEGLLGGLLHIALKDQPQVLISKRVAFLTVLVGEILHMGIVLALTRPFEAAVAIVKVIGLPMVLLTTLLMPPAILLKMVLRPMRSSRAVMKTRPASVTMRASSPSLRSCSSRASGAASSVFPRLSKTLARLR